MFREVSEDDRCYLMWLEDACMRDYAVALWGVWRPRPDDDLILADHRIVVSDRADVGCVSISRHPDHLWVDKLHIAPGYQRQGLGALVLRRVLSEAADIGLPVRLSVLATNPAKAFYLRAGLRPTLVTAERTFMTS